MADTLTVKAAAKIVGCAPADIVSVQDSMLAEFPVHEVTTAAGSVYRVGTGGDVVPSNSQLQQAWLEAQRAPKRSKSK